MGLLNNLFTSNDKGINKNGKQLIDFVDKIDDPEKGAFANIMNDLGSYITKVGKGEDKLRKMAYGYARRTAAAGLCAQGVWGQQDFDYTCNVFFALQQETGQTVEFQETANNQAIQLIKTYDPRLSRELQNALVIFMCKDASEAKRLSTFMSYNDVIEKFIK